MTKEEAWQAYMHAAAGSFDDFLVAEKAFKAGWDARKRETYLATETHQAAEGLGSRELCGDCGGQGYSGSYLGPMLCPTCSGRGHSAVNPPA